jgi:putative AlgH/UPF0301 family transcriptional regulator
VFFGGPVQTERGFVLHEKPGRSRQPLQSTMSVPGGLEMTTSKDVLEAMSSGAGRAACWSRWATAAGRPASWKTNSAATAG